MGNKNNNPNANNSSKEELSQQPNKVLITPSALAVSGEDISPQEAERRGLGMSQLLNRFYKPDNDKACRKSEVKIDPSRLLVTKLKGGERYGLDSQVVPVPFDVILATMDPQLMDTLKKLAPGLTSADEKEVMKQQQWKLHGNGFYVNYDLGYELIIITSEMIYKGVVVVNKEKKIVPDEKGLLLTKQGKYDGNFKNGKADGQGVYTDKKTMTAYEGIWKNGFIVNGKIVNEEFEFEGPIDKAANGNGAIRFMKTGSSYTGNFLNGKYSTVGKDTARYKTLQYLYVGHFKDGKKEGHGRLEEFQKLKQSKINPSQKNQKQRSKPKYRPRDDYDGLWIDDYFVTTRVQREQKRMRDAQVMEQAQNKIMQQVLQNPNFQLQQQPEVQIKKPSSDKPGDTSKTDVPIPEVVEEQEIQSEI